jgi:hypothetical protein
MRTTRQLTVLICSISLAVGCATAEPESDLRLDIADDDIELTVSSETVRSLLAEALDHPLECSGDVDPDLRAFLERLDRGPRARATLTSGDGTLTGRRRGGRLELRANGTEGGRLEATLPWAVGECLLGRGTTVERALGAGRIPVEVRVVSADGGTLVARVE